MYGAIVGDIVGSIFEFNNCRSKDFPFVSPGCSYTDDSIMTVAVARALLDVLAHKGSLRERLICQMQALGKAYPYPQGGYGGRFFGWLRDPDPQPYHSCGNGSAMRASACGLIAVTLEEALALAEASAAVTHDHPEGIKGAQALAAGVFLARQGKGKDEIRACLQRFYPLDRTLDEIRPGYGFSEICQTTVPEAIQAFLESESYEDAIRNAISLGGDSDTIGAITGGIAWSYYRWPRGEDATAAPAELPDWATALLAEHGIDAMLPRDFVETIRQLDEARAQRAALYAQTGSCPQILPTVV
ncbi:MAG: ADP-ribosylglycohydrolase family protein [Oscillospiraceae bacterium]|nr:ADP-ribosylglycohydrolase family protein [Oscillospiraceae bacterium]